MKRFSCWVVTLILLVGYTSFYLQTFDQVQAIEIEIQGQIGGENSTTQSLKESEQKNDIKLAQPKQTHIELNKFPNTGSLIEKLSLYGGVLLLIYLILNRWKAHKKK
ncbi:hypothetical protein [Candidatus Enterococcus mansonii]|uniref:Uncharacterized protein n=1 Tax=Candidatus Enterococcus mansonii TaxID=1834181 RepID=A0A242CGK5_9ENTE|nr:hypothetical protein [Enterococcus sp. 4G2_DIV0659]OTO09373.1 hypothetical protein A5880_000052 [Enterococcus sp. 4G2_DIV0659]